MWQQNSDNTWKLRHPSKPLGGGLCAEARDAAILLGDFLWLTLKQM